MAAGSASSRTLKIVVGYVPGVDRIPKPARAFGCANRVALVLDTYRPEAVDMVLDEELYLAGLEIQTRLLHAEGLVLGAKPLDPSLRVTLGDLTARLNAKSPVTREPFERILVVHGDDVVGLIESEPWARVGGPEPYHDSYTIAVYSKEPIAAAFEAEMRRASDAMGATLLGVIQGKEAPEPRGLWATIERLFRIRRRD